MLNIRNRPIVKIGNPTDRVRARERIYKSKRSLKRCQDFSRSPGRIYRTLVRRCLYTYTYRYILYKRRAKGKLIEIEVRQHKRASYTERSFERVSDYAWFEIYFSHPKILRPFDRV